MAHDVFVSYSTEDRVLAQAVCARLEEARLRCWIAPRDIEPGSIFAESIVNAISESSVMILVFSRYAIKSQYVGGEVHQAFERGIPIIPFRIENVAPSGGMALLLSQVHWLDALDEPKERHLIALRDNVLSLLGRATERVAPPPVPPPLQTGFHICELRVIVEPCWMALNSRLYLDMDGTSMMSWHICEGTEQTIHARTDTRTAKVDYGWFSRKLTSAVPRCPQATWILRYDRLWGNYKVEQRLPG